MPLHFGTSDPEIERCATIRPLTFARELPSDSTLLIGGAHQRRSKCGVLRCRLTPALDTSGSFDSRERCNEI